MSELHGHGIYVPKVLLKVFGQDTLQDEARCALSCLALRRWGKCALCVTSDRRVSRVIVANIEHSVTMQYLWVNGADQGQNVNLRVPPNNNPVTDVTSKDITCNVGGTSGSGVSTATIPAGANVRLNATHDGFAC